MCASSALKTRLKWSGISRELLISIAAPETDMSLIKQLTMPPTNSIAPDINTVLRGCTRLSMKAACVEILKNRCRPRFGQKHFHALFWRNAVLALLEPAQ